MAATFDATSGASPGSVSSFNFSHSVGASADRVLVVGVIIRDTAAQVVSSISSSVDGAFTHVITADGTSCRVEVWKLLDPTNTSHTITVNLSGAGRVCAVSLSAFDASDVANTVTDTGQTTTSPDEISVNVASGSGDLAFDVVGVEFTIGNLPTMTVGAGQTERQNRTDAGSPGGNDFIRGGCSTQPGASAVMSWDISLAGKNWALVGASFVGVAQDRRGQLSWAELELPNAPRRGQVSWGELEIPSASRRALISWAELELIEVPELIANFIRPRRRRRLLSLD